MAWWGSGCWKVGVLSFPRTSRLENQFSACHLPALNLLDLATFWFYFKERGVGGDLLLLGGWGPCSYHSF